MKRVLFSVETDPPRVAFSLKFVARDQNGRRVKEKRQKEGRMEEDEGESEGERLWEQSWEDEEGEGEGGKGEKEEEEEEEEDEDLCFFSSESEVVRVAKRVEGTCCSLSVVVRPLQNCSGLGMKVGFKVVEKQRGKNVLIRWQNKKKSEKKDEEEEGGEDQEGWQRSEYLSSEFYKNFHSVLGKRERLLSLISRPLSRLDSERQLLHLQNSLWNEFQHELDLLDGGEMDFAGLGTRRDGEGRGGEGIGGVLGEEELGSMSGALSREEEEKIEKALLEYLRSLRGYLFCWLRCDNVIDFCGGIGAVEGREGRGNGRTGDSESLSTHPPSPSSLPSYSTPPAASGVRGVADLDVSKEFAAFDRVRYCLGGLYDLLLQGGGMKGCGGEDCEGCASSEDESEGWGGAKKKRRLVRGCVGREGEGESLFKKMVLYNGAGVGESGLEVLLTRFGREGDSVWNGRMLLGWLDRVCVQPVKMKDYFSFEVFLLFSSFILFYFLSFFHFILLFIPLHY